MVRSDCNGVLVETQTQKKRLQIETDANPDTADVWVASECDGAIIGDHDGGVTAGWWPLLGKPFDL